MQISLDIKNWNTTRTTLTEEMTEYFSLLIIILISIVQESHMLRSQLWMILYYKSTTRDMLTSPRRSKMVKLMNKNKILSNIQNLFLTCTLLLLSMILKYQCLMHIQNSRD